MFYLVKDERGQVVAARKTGRTYTHAVTDENGAHAWFGRADLAAAHKAKYPASHIVEVEEVDSITYSRENKALTKSRGIEAATQRAQVEADSSGTAQLVYKGWGAANVVIWKFRPYAGEPLENFYGGAVVVNPTPTQEAEQVQAQIVEQVQAASAGRFRLAAARVHPDDEAHQAQEEAKRDGLNQAQSLNPASRVYHVYGVTPGWVGYDAWLVATAPEHEQPTDDLYTCCGCGLYQHGNDFGGTDYCGQCRAKQDQDLAEVGALEGVLGNEDPAEAEEEAAIIAANYASGAVLVPINIDTLGLDELSADLMKAARARFDFTNARVLDVMRTAQAIQELDGEPTLALHHVAEAINYHAVGGLDQAATRYTNQLVADAKQAHGPLLERWRQVRDLPDWEDEIRAQGSRCAVTASHTSVVVQRIQAVQMAQDPRQGVPMAREYEKTQRELMDAGVWRRLSAAQKLGNARAAFDWLASLPSPPLPGDLKLPDGSRV